MALSQGARLNELCQLERTGVVQVDGIWRLDKNGKRLKSISSYSINIE